MSIKSTNANKAEFIVTSLASTCKSVIEVICLVMYQLIFSSCDSHDPFYSGLIDFEFFWLGLKREGPAGELVWADSGLPVSAVCRFLFVFDFI